MSCKTRQDIDSREERLANINIQRALYTVSPMIDSLAKYQNQMDLLHLFNFILF